jgi:hypothetical protein
MVDAGIPKDRIECVPGKWLDTGPSLLAEDLGTSCEPFIGAVTAALAIDDPARSPAAGIRVLVLCESTADLWISAETFPYDPVESDLTVYRLV